MPNAEDCNVCEATALMMMGDMEMAENESKVWNAWRIDKTITQSNDKDISGDNFEPSNKPTTGFKQLNSLPAPPSFPSQARDSEFTHVNQLP